MTLQKYPNPLKDPELPFRFARFIGRHLVKMRLSDDQLVRKMSEVAGRTISAATVQRHKNAQSTPSYQMIGIFQQSLGATEEDVSRLLDPHVTWGIGTPGYQEVQSQFQQLVAELNRQSQLPNHIQQERAKANVALREQDFDKAREHLEAVGIWTRTSYEDHANAFKYAKEEYSRALGSLGALAFTAMDFSEARNQYGKALSLKDLPPERLNTYKHAYRVASNAVAARTKSETEARAILAEMVANDVTPDVVSYSTLLNFVKSETEARAILAEMVANDVTPNVVSYSTLLNFVKSETEARAILAEMVANDVTPNVVSYNTLLNFVKSETEARAILAEMVANDVTPDVVSYSTLLNFVKSETEARAILAEMVANDVTPNVVSYSTLLNFVKSETEARAILAEMVANDVTPNVVSYNTLLNFVKSETEARAILAEMVANDVTPNGITIVTAIGKSGTFEEALCLADHCIAKGFFVGRGAFEAAYSKPISHLTAERLLAEYHARPYKFDTSLEGPINQYRKSRQSDQALPLTLAAPHVGAAQKLYRQEYALCRSYFEAERASGNDEDNVYYAYGIAAALNGDWKNARPNLKIALARAHAAKRIEHIARLLSQAPSE